MTDGSLRDDGKTPASYDCNVEVTRKTVDMAHACGVSVEGELGCLGSLETGEAGEEDGVGAEGKLSQDQLLTDPEESAHCVARYEAFGTAGNADKIKVVGLEAMSERYASGELDPNVN